MTYTDNQITLAKIYSACPICHDDWEHCPRIKGKHARGRWQDGDALLELREKLGALPYVARHRKGRHAL